MAGIPAGGPRDSNVIGVIKHVRKDGGVIIPADMRDRLGIQTDDELNVFEHNSIILLEPTLFKCVYCGKQRPREEKFIDGVPICPACIAHIKHMDCLYPRDQL